MPLVVRHRERMQAISNELKEDASARYTDEEAIEGNFVTRIDFEVDKLADLLDHTSLECHVALEDTLVAEGVADRGGWRMARAEEEVPSGLTTA